MREMAGVTPIPDATATKFSLSIAGELNGLKYGPMMNAGLSVGVDMASISFPVQPPHA